MVSQSKVLAYMKKLHFCKVTPVSIQTFVEGLLRLANVLEATNGTLKNVNNICTLAINSTKYFVLFSGDLTSIYIYPFVIIQIKFNILILILSRSRMMLSMFSDSIRLFHACL
jgi:hypothetical protein